MATPILRNRHSSFKTTSSTFTDENNNNDSSRKRRSVSSTRASDAKISDVLLGLVLIAIFYTIGIWLGKSTNFTPLHSTSSDTTEPPFLQEAIDHCNAAEEEYGQYPFMYEEIIEKRVKRWRHVVKDNYLEMMLNDKLGGLMYATKLGIRTPRILFCGKAKDLADSMDSFGNKYVIKPLTGHSAEGVKVVRDGVDIMDMMTPISYDVLTKEYAGIDESETEMIVEELVESANPKYDGLIPPDYKFQTYGGGKTELLVYIDRNEQLPNRPECSDNFDISSTKGWRFLEGVIITYSRGPCPDEIRKDLEKDTSRQKAMKQAVQILADNIGPNHYRIDMYDSIHGPVLGEFTPYGGKGHGEPLFNCIMTYLFIRHAEYGAGKSDDYGLIQDDLLEEANLFKTITRMKTTFEGNAKHSTDKTLDSRQVEAREWLHLDKMTKCHKVIAAQREYDSNTKSNNLDLMGS